MKQIDCHCLFWDISTFPQDSWQRSRKFSVADSGNRSSGYEKLIGKGQKQNSKQQRNSEQGVGYVNIKCAPLEFMNVCVCTCACMYVHTHVAARGPCLKSFSVVLHVFDSGSLSKPGSPQFSHVDMPEIFQISHLQHPSTRAKSNSSGIFFMSVGAQTYILAFWLSLFPSPDNNLQVPAYTCHPKFK